MQSPLLRLIRANRNVAADGEGGEPLDKSAGLRPLISIQSNFAHFPISRTIRGSRAYADEEVDATAAEANVGELLGVAPGASVLRIRQVIGSA
jgi:hypothetical protein